MRPDCVQHVSRHLSACSPLFPKSFHRVNAHGRNGYGRPGFPRPLLLTSLPARLESCTWRLLLDVSCRRVASTGMYWSHHTQQLIIGWSRRYLVAPFYFYDPWVPGTHSDAKGLTLHLPSPRSPRRMTSPFSLAPLLVRVRSAGCKVTTSG